MEKNDLIAQLFKKGQDHEQAVYLVTFFLVFVLLIVLVVRPTVDGYVTRRKELAETKLLSSQYQKVISSLNTLQSMLEMHRDDFALLDEAIPESVQMYQISRDIERSVLPHIPSRSYSFPAYTIVHDGAVQGEDSIAKPQEYKLAASLQGEYQTLQDVVAKLMNQLRVKSISSVSLDRTRGASDSANLDMRLEIKAYHL